MEYKLYEDHYYYSNKVYKCQLRSDFEILIASNGMVASELPKDITQNEIWDIHNTALNILDDEQELLIESHKEEIEFERQLTAAHIYNEFKGFIFLSVPLSLLIAGAIIIFSRILHLNTDIAYVFFAVPLIGLWLMFRKSLITAYSDIILNINKINEHRK